MSTRIVLLVEERSMEITMDEILPKVLPGTPHQIVTFRGKPDLLRKLPSRLAGLRYEVRHGTRVAIVVDREAEDCQVLVRRLRDVVTGAGLAVDRSGPLRGDVLCRVACEELEAWFLGDVDALRAAYPRVPVGLAEQAPFRNPDAVTGGTAERLHEVLRAAGSRHERLPKTQVAAAVSREMNPDRNRSNSFQVTVAGLRRLAGKGV